MKKTFLFILIFLLFSVSVSAVNYSVTGCDSIRDDYTVLGTCGIGLDEQYFNLLSAGIRLDFSLYDTAPISNMSFFYTGNGTNTCAMGNRDTTCYEYPNFIEYNNGTTTSTYRDWNLTYFRDGINCTQTPSASNKNINYSCYIFEHYYPNIFKWYDANFDMNNITLEDEVGERIQKNKFVKIELDDTIVPADADSYEIRVNAQFVSVPTPLKTYVCDSNYTSGNPANLSGCAYIDERVRGDSSVNNNYQFNFTKTKIENISTLKYVFFQVPDTQIGGSYFVLRSSSVKNTSWTSKFEFTTDNGSTWNANAGNQTEAQFIFHWWNNRTSQTKTIFKWGVNNGSGLFNSSEYVLNWTLRSDFNYTPPPVASTTTPASGGYPQPNPVYVYEWGLLSSMPEISLKERNLTLLYDTKTTDYFTIVNKGDEVDISIKCTGLFCERVTFIAEQFSLNKNSSLDVSYEINTEGLEWFDFGQFLVIAEDEFGSSDALSVFVFISPLGLLNVCWIYYMFLVLVSTLLSFIATTIIKMGFGMKKKRLARLYLTPLFFILLIFFVYLLNSLAIIPSVCKF